MELSDPITPDTSTSSNDATTRRRSGRVTQKPVLYNQNVAVTGNGSGKRKRFFATERESSEEEGDSSTSLDESDGDPDEEEIKERRRRSRGKTGTGKPAAKKQKTTKPSITNLPVRSAINGVKKASKPRKPRAPPRLGIADEGAGLFCEWMLLWSAKACKLLTRYHVAAEIFSQGHSVDDVATEWISRYDNHNANAMRDLVNFVLKCTGCDLQVDVHDIEDPDNATSKLDDLQAEYQAQNITIYPLISKAKEYAPFRSTVTGFFHSLIISAHASGILYSDLGLVEHIEVWVTSMSSSPIRPFRHTATVIGLAMEGALCSVFSDLAESIAATTRQKEGEQKKKAVNKTRITDLQKLIAEGERKSGIVNTIMENIFTGMYVHRYRDVDPRIRVDCVTALGTWITTAPDKFFASSYLRYLGWILSDTSTPTRAEVVKQLSRLYKNKEDVGRLRSFTERFRPRFVEMAIRDAEPNIRAAAVGLLDMIRGTGLLEPDDIDSVGRLIFDSEPKVRRAVAGFFAENATDLFESVVEDLGGEEGIAEAIGEEVEENYDKPRKTWLKFKCIAEVLQSYSTEDAEGDGELEIPVTKSSLLAFGADSRISLAAQAIYEGVKEVKNWEALAGYLLFDSSTAAQNGRGAHAPDTLFKEKLQLNEQEEVILLEVLNVAVKQRLLEAVDSETDKKGKKPKARIEKSRKIQDTTASHLANIIPRLLKKFGADPATASAVLRLEHVLNLDVFEELRQDSTVYASLLDDINKQFLTHGDQGVLAEASITLLHARSFKDLEEVTEGKVQELWNDTVGTLRGAVAARASGKSSDLTELSNTICRIANLASISDCVTIFESKQQPISKKAHPAMTVSPLSIITDLINDDYSDTDDEQLAERDDLVSGAIRSLVFYYMWLVRSLQTSIAANHSISTLPNYEPFASALLSVMESRSGADLVRLAAAGAYLDLYTLFASLRNEPAATFTPQKNQNKVQTSSDTDVQSLIRSIPANAQSIVLNVYGAAEKYFARKTHRRLEPAPDDAIDSAPEDLESDSEDEDDDDSSSDERKAQILVAEKQLCELAGKLVLAIVARVLDAESGSNSQKGRVRERLGRNKARLGANFREVLAFLDEPKGKAKKERKPKAKAKGAKSEALKASKSGKSEAIVVESGSESSEEEVNGELADDRIEDGDESAGEAEKDPEPVHEDEQDEIMGD